MSRTCVVSRSCHSRHNGIRQPERRSGVEARGQTARPDRRLFPTSSSSGLRGLTVVSYLHQAEDAVALAVQLRYAERRHQLYGTNDA
jgi:hypothetical protein